VRPSVKTAPESAIANIARRGTLSSVGVLEFIGGAYLRTSLLHSAGVDALLRTGRELDDFRRMPQMLHAPGCGKTVGRSPKCALVFAKYLAAQRGKTLGQARNSFRSLMMPRGRALS
jgi:hypothetical protein